MSDLQNNQSTISPLYKQADLLNIIKHPILTEKMIRLTDMLEDCDDVQNVYSNANISEEVLAQLDNL